MHACIYAQPMQTYILHPNMKIIKIKASDLYEKQQKIYTHERGKLGLFILPKSYSNLHTFICLYTCIIKIKAMDLI